MAMRFCSGGVGHKSTREATDYFLSDRDHLDLRECSVDSENDVEDDGEDHSDDEVEALPNDKEQCAVDMDGCEESVDEDGEDDWEDEWEEEDEPWLKGGEGGNNDDVVDDVLGPNDGEEDDDDDWHWDVW